MEKAIVVRRLSDLNDSAKEYDYIYFGVEFCQWLIPSIADLKTVSAFCKENGIGLVLVTPWVTDSGLETAQKLIAKFLEDEDKLEVLVNDFGLLKLINDEFKGKVTVTLGRLLSNQRRDPRTLPLKEVGSTELYKHYQHSSFDYQPFIDYAKTFGVTRVEIDNLEQGVIVPPDLSGVSFSVHYPYNYITVARNCAFCYDGPAGLSEDTHNQSTPWANKKGCKKLCIDDDTTLTMKNDEIDEPLYMKGTATFIKNDDLKDIKDGLVNRLVYSPYIPV
ncbi:hypothetical protein ACFL2A_03515 [Thermodesulfobacteriota bacterium]